MIYLIGLAISFMIVVIIMYFVISSITVNGDNFNMTLVGAILILIVIAASWITVALLILFLVADWTRKDVILFKIKGSKH